MEADPFPLEGTLSHGGAMIVFEPSDLPSPGQRDAYAYWLQARGGNDIPDIAAIDPLSMPRSALPLLGVLDVTDDDFQVRIAGTTLTDMLGREFKGILISSLKNAEGGVARLRWCVRNRRAYFSRSSLSWSGKQFKTYGVLVMPFGTTDKVERLLLVFDFERV